MKNIVKYIRKSEKFDISQMELAQATGISRGTIVRIENGGHTNSENMQKIANFFNMHPREIFFTDDVLYTLQKTRSD